MKKGSVFASKKGPIGTGFGTPISSSSTSSSFFDSSLQQQNPLGGSTRNWQATPTNTRRLPPFQHSQLLHPSSSTTSIRAYTMAPTTVVSSNTPNTSIINRAKPYTIQSLIETLNEVNSYNLKILIFSFTRFCLSLVTC